MVKIPSLGQSYTNAVLQLSQGKKTVLKILPEASSTQTWDRGRANLYCPVPLAAPLHGALMWDHGRIFQGERHSRRGYRLENVLPERRACADYSLREG